MYIEKKAGVSKKKQETQNKIVNLFMLNWHH